MKINYKILTFLTIILFLNSCHSTKQEKTFKKDVSVKKLNSEPIIDKEVQKEESKEKTFQPKILGGWENISVNDTLALKYYSEIRKIIIKEKGWILALKPYKIAIQIVAGRKYHYYTDVTNKEINGKISIIIWVRLDNKIEILEYKFYS